MVTQMANTESWKYGFNPDRLKALIRESGITQNTLSEITGIGVASLNGYTSRGTEPRLKHLMTLADFFAVPLDFLCGRCDFETATKVLDNYSAHFMQLRQAPWEWYLWCVRPKGGQAQDYTGKWEAPWPYNLVDEIFRKPTDYLLTDDHVAGLDAAMNTLTERERVGVLLMYRDGKTLDDIGLVFGVTRERVRQIVAKAVRKLRHPSRSKLIRNGLKGYERLNEIARKEYELAKREQAIAELEKELAWREQKIIDKENELNIEVDLSQKPATGVLAMELWEMDLSVRSFNVLARAGCKTLGDVVALAKSGNLLNVRNCGRKSVKEIQAKIKELTGIDCDENKEVVEHFDEVTK